MYLLTSALVVLLPVTFSSPFSPTTRSWALSNFRSSHKYSCPCEAHLSSKLFNSTTSTNPPPLPERTFLRLSLLLFETQALNAMSLAAPAEKDGFSYAGDSLYCEASNLNRHRRATLSELKAHFAGKDGENRPAHWYEAQLLHYGLPPSKVKGTAHKRLFDAVTKGGLAVPAHVKKIEADLKKEWTKKEREAKKVIRESAAAPSSSRGTKRKADQASTNVSVNVSVQVSSTGTVKTQVVQPAAKKTKATKTIPTKTKGKEKATKPAGNATTTAAKQKKASTAKPAPAPKSARSPSKPKALTGQTPRKPVMSSSSNAEVPGYALGVLGADYDEAPPPYSTFDLGRGSSSQERPQASPKRKLGLLNGRYRISCPDIEYDYPEHMSDFALIATLDGDNLWLKFDFGAMTGMIKIPRPFEASEDHYGMSWRGHHIYGSTSRRFVNNDRPGRAGPLNYLVFLGGGHIQGSLCANSSTPAVNFDAYRLSGQSMTSEISPAEARAEWVRLEQNMDMSW